MRNHLDISDRVAVVIGATSGIGRMLAIGLAEHGATVVPSGRRADRLAGVCAELEDAGRPTLRQTADVRERASIDALRNAVLNRFGRVDIVINAAAYTVKRPTASISEAEWSGLLNTDLTACSGCVIHEPLKDSGRGRLSTSHARIVLAFHGVAATVAKAGVLADGASPASGPRDGISVNTIAPACSRPS